MPASGSSQSLLVNARPYLDVCHHLVCQVQLWQVWLWEVPTAAHTLDVMHTPYYQTDNRWYWAAHVQFHKHSAV